MSKNFGHQHALKAGIDHCRGDCAISLDGDLQHPPSLIPTLIEKCEEGFEIVYTKRLEDDNLSFFKRLTSYLFYSILNKLSEIKLEQGAADFRLMDRKVIKVFKEITDHNLFIRGLVSWVGFNSYCIEYNPQIRHSGHSKYSLKKMLILALNGITSFSVKPLRFSTYVGLTSSSLSFIYAIYAAYKSLFTTDVISGWSSTIISILFIGGIQLFVLGIIGEYLGKLFIQSKGRPYYLIQETNIKNDQS